MLQRTAAAVDAGFPHDALIQMVKVYADALGRVAEAEGRLSTSTSTSASRRPPTGSDLAVATARSSDQLRALVEPTIFYFHRKATTRALHDHVATHLFPRGSCGIPEEVELCEIRREGATAPVLLVDPVCGMGLASDDIVARLHVDGRDHVFCSSRCLERYVEAPDRFP